MSDQDQLLTGYWMGKHAGESKLKVISMNDDGEGYISIEIEGVGNLSVNRWELAAALAVIQAAADGSE